MEKKKLISSKIYSPIGPTNEKVYTTPFTPHIASPPWRYEFKRILIEPQEHYYTPPAQIIGPLPKDLTELEEKSQFVLCPNCGKHVFTFINHRRGCVMSSMMFICVCLLFCLLGLWICVPCIFWCHCRKRKISVRHYCPRCEELIYEYEPGN